MKKSIDKDTEEPWLKYRKDWFIDKNYLVFPQNSNSINSYLSYFQEADFEQLFYFDERHYY